MTAKRKGPRPGSLQQGSLASKLANIRIEETIYFDDDHMSSDIPTQMERQVQGVIHKSSALKSRRFVTRRYTAIRTGRDSVMKPVLGVRRLRDKESEQ